MNSLRIGKMAVFLCCVLASLGARAQSITQHVFTSNPDGANPLSLTFANGFLWGSTAYGGANNDGYLFKFDTNGPAITPVYSFTGAANNGTTPNDVLVTNGTIYGTTEAGGTNGVGTIYSVNAGGSGFSVLYSFGAGAQDGQTPLSGLALGGVTLYGTANNGGMLGDGTIFKINTNGSGYSTLHLFTNSPDGYAPSGTLLLYSNSLYGVTTYGGANGKGAIFSINTNGSNYRVIYSFNVAPDPNYPYGGLSMSSGVLYGMGSSGGTNATGGIFAINLDGTGYRQIHSFAAYGSAEGTIPKAGMTVFGNALYGTTTSGGSGGGGTLFLINTNGSGFSVLASFTNNAQAGFDLLGNPIRVGSSVWGTTYQGGSPSHGTLYRVPMPAVTSQPQSLTVPNNSPASFSVTAADDSSISYQWYENGSTLLGGQTSPTLSFANATTGNQGSYTVVVSDSFGSVTSSPAVLTVLVSGTKPSITQQPQSLTVTNGDVAYFTNAATGTAPLYYQWYFNTNTPVGGATGAILTISPATTNQAGYYTVIVTNLYGAATSAPALLTVTVPAGARPSITQQPQSITVTNGYTALFTNVATGSGLSYQWYFNTNTPVPGGTNAILSLPLADTVNAGYYTVIVTNTGGSVTSSPALLTIISTAPIIIVQPQPLVVTNGSPFSFTVIAAGKAPLSYQWYTNNALSHFNQLKNQTSATVSFPSASPPLTGNYLVTIINSLGKATSSPALLSITSKPVITQNPQDLSVSAGSPATFTAAAIGEGLLHYQWFFQTNTLLANANSTSLTLPSADPQASGYYSLIVTNTFGSATSSYALLTVTGSGSGSGFPQILSFSINGSGHATFVYSNTPSTSNRVWYTTNLANGTWIALATNVMAPSGIWNYTDPSAVSASLDRFYRFSAP
jgi:uncharacterized repeat protein (TIGR03803 family)